MGILSTILDFIGLGKFVHKFLYPEPVVQKVNLKYAEESGLHESLSKSGYEIRWVYERDVQSKIDNEGYSKIFHSPKTSKPTILMVEDRPHNLILIKKRKNA